MSNDNKNLVRKLNRAIEGGDLDTVQAIIHPDLTHGRKGLELTLPIIMKRGPKPPSAAQGFLNASAAIKDTFDGWYAKEDMLVAEGEWVIAKQTMSGRLKGTFPGSDRVDPEFSFPMVVMFKFDGGRVIEIWALGDELGFWHQMGVPLGGVEA